MWAYPSVVSAAGPRYALLPCSPSESAASALPAFCNLLNDSWVKLPAPPRNNLLLHQDVNWRLLQRRSLRAFGWLQGLLVTIAIGLHNVPEGLAVATVLVAKGISPMHAFWWTLATSLPQPLLALPSFMFVDAFQALLPLALGFAAGCMVWIVFAELLPDALAGAPHTQVSVSSTRRNEAHHANCQIMK